MLSCAVAPGCAEDAGVLFPDPGFMVPVSAPNSEPDPAAAPAAVEPDVAPDATGGTEAGPSSPVGLDMSEPAPAPMGGDSPAEGAGESSEPDMPPEMEPGDSGAEPGRAEDLFGQARVCADVAEPLLLDFEDAGDNPSQGLFGDFQSALSGGTYFYPDLSTALEGEEPLGLTSDVTEGDWHISGSVAQTAGFGLFFACEQLDASRFVGLAFRIQGSIGSPELLEFIVGTAANEPSRAWLLENGGSAEPSFGRCTPAQSEFDGTCTSARIEIAVSEESREVFVPFSALGGGRPEPNPNPAEITAIAWALPSPAVDASGDLEPYAVDLRLDDIRFVEAE